MKKLLFIWTLVLFTGCSDNPVSRTDQEYTKVIIYGNELIDSINVERLENGLSPLRFTDGLYTYSESTGEIILIDVKEIASKRDFNKSKRSKWQLSEVRDATCYIGGVKRWSNYNFSTDAYNNPIIQTLLNDKRENLYIYLEINDYPKTGIDYLNDSPDVEINAKWDLILCISEDQFL